MQLQVNANIQPAAHAHADQHLVNLQTKKLQKKCCFVGCSSNSLNHGRFICIPSIPKPLPANASEKNNLSMMKRLNKRRTTCQMWAEKNESRKHLRFCSLHNLSPAIISTTQSKPHPSQSRKCCFFGCKSTSKDSKNFTHIQSIPNPLPPD